VAFEHVARCDCSSIKPSLIWMQREEPRDKKREEFIASLTNEPYQADFDFPLQPLNKLANDGTYAHGHCTYFEVDGIDYVWADQSLCSLQPRMRHGASTVLTLGKVPRPWNHDPRNDNWTTLQWPFLIFSTLHRDGPLFAAHILDLRSDLKFCAALAPNRLAVFSLDDLVFSPKPVHELRHKSLFAPHLDPARCDHRQRSHEVMSYHVAQRGDGQRASQQPGPISVDELPVHCAPLGIWSCRLLCWNSSGPFLRPVSNVPWET